MAKKPNRNQWAAGYHKQVVAQRQFMWHPETIALLAKWLGFKHGQTVVDVGCGLGYLGMTYWPYFGKHGTYFGVDLSPELVKTASRNKSQWAIGGQATFKAGDAYKLPLPDNCADTVMCQTLMIHLGDPKRALSEMIRVAKPGGIVCCMESDMLSMAMAQGYDTLPQKSINDILFLHKFHLLTIRGRAKLGEGDYNIGPKLPAMMSSLGLSDIDARNTNKVDILIPPYGTGEQQHNYRFDLEMYTTPDWEKRYRIGMKEYRKYIIAGGGTMRDYQRFAKLSSKQSPAFQAKEKQLRNGVYAEFSPRIFYVIKGRKPR
jgi:ubiquinone/menaquinone biosynthesis C-methylase UbiE